MKIEYFTKEQLKSLSKNELVRMYLKVTDLVNKSYADYEKVVHCKDCKHRPRRSNVDDEHEGFNLEFPDEKCPGLCDDDPWYNWMPRDDWYCGNGERKEE